MKSLKEQITESLDVNESKSKLPKDFLELADKLAPLDADSWRNATDEIKDICVELVNYYNEIDLDLLRSEVEDGKGIQHVTRKDTKTPSDWNKKYREKIEEVYSKSSTQVKKYFEKYYKEFL